MARVAAPTLLPAGVDFASAVVQVLQGRDTVVVDARSDRLLVHFADNDLGADVYEVAITFALAAAVETVGDVERVPRIVATPERAVQPAHRSRVTSPWRPSVSTAPPVTVLGPLSSAPQQPRAPLPSSPEERVLPRPIAPPVRAPIAAAHLCATATEDRLDAALAVHLQAASSPAPALADFSGRLDARGNAAPSLRLDAALHAALFGRRLSLASVIWPASGDFAAGAITNVVDVSIR